MTKGTILIIEDNRVNLDMATELLQVAGFEVLQAKDADTGISIAREAKPDAVLMDMYLPAKSGYEAASILRTEPETQDIVIIGFTALAMKSDMEKALAHGCSGVISKPIDVGRFAETVASYIGQTPSRTSSSPEELQSRFAPSDDPEERAFQEFLSSLSHDLQAPLRKIQQFTSFLKRDNPEDIRYVEGIERSAQQMYEVLSQGLDRYRNRPRGK